MTTEKATLGGGCFWCVEAAFEELEGVTDVTSGYAGGDEPEPTYQAVCSGSTGHAEVVQLEYDPDTITYPDLLRAFFTIHDPTTLNREGPDVGSQYRSIVLFHDEDQRADAEQFIDGLEMEGAYEDDEIVTAVESLDTFYRAEENHQNYYEKNPRDRYCTHYAEPKIQKVREKFDATASESP